MLFPHILAAISRRLIKNCVFGVLGKNDEKKQHRVAKRVHLASGWVHANWQEPPRRIYSYG
jgi:hypothetical protein